MTCCIMILYYDIYIYIYPLNPKPYIYIYIYIYTYLFVLFEFVFFCDVTNKSPSILASRHRELKERKELVGGPGPGERGGGFRV